MLNHLFWRSAIVAGMLCVIGVTGVAMANGSTALQTAVAARSGTTQAAAFDGVVEAVRQTVVAAQVAGAVVALEVKAGDTVAKGQALAVMEAMKMEHTIAAPADGTVAELLYAPGDQVTEGAELLRLALQAVDAGLAALREDGTQKNLLDRMMPRERFRKVLSDAEYVAFEIDRLLSLRYVPPTTWLFMPLLQMETAAEFFKNDDTSKGRNNKFKSETLLNLETYEA